MTRELSPVDRCRANKWVVGTILKVLFNERGSISMHFYKITAIGEHDILVRELFDPFEKITGGEFIAPFGDPDLVHIRRVSKKRVDAYFGA